MSNKAAPIKKIFIDVPPTRDEAPEGYITSACGKKFQRANALLFDNAVGIVLEPDTTGINIVVKKSVLK